VHPETASADQGAGDTLVQDATAVQNYCAKTAYVAAQSIPGALHVFGVRALQIRGFRQC